MLTDRSEPMNKAAEFWREGQPLEAGKLIFEHLPQGIQPIWAVNILELVLKRTGITSPPIERVIKIANHREDWGKAHEAFLSIRRSALEMLKLKARSPQQTLLLSHLSLAELVAKVTYNATNPPDEFDEDSGWWIAVCLKGIIDLAPDEKFSRDMWSALCSE